MTISLKTPVSKQDLEKLKVGDRVLLSGKIYTARDQAHLRLVSDSKLYFELKNATLYYVGPTPARPGNIIGSSGPTSSYRMDNLAVPLMEKGVSVMIGKGDRSKEFRLSLVENKAVYMIATGGAGALLASRVKSSKVIMYEDLGPEAVHELIVEDFPCIVAYDIHGNDIFSTT